MSDVSGSAQQLHRIEQRLSPYPQLVTVKRLADCGWIGETVGIEP